MNTKEQKQRWYQEHRDLSIARAKKYRLDHPDWAKKVNLSINRSEFMKSWRKRNPTTAKELQEHTSLLRRFSKHGLTLDQYHAMAESQDFLCAVCNEEPIAPPIRSKATVYDNFVIDHNHRTNKVRGLTCSVCNVAIGMVRERPDIARNIATYLEKHSPTNSGLEVQSHDDSSLVSTILNHV